MTKHIMKLEQINKSKYSSFTTRLFTGSVIGVLAIVGVLTFSKTAHASLISLVSSIFGGEAVSAKVDRSIAASDNSQTAPILQVYAVNIDQNPEKLPDIIPIDNSNTLNSDLASTNSTGTDTSNTQISTYVVRSGDTISSVAKMFKVSVNTILWANNLTGKSVLKEGQTLVILPITGIPYTIKKGDTVKGIAAKYKADETDIISYNDLTVQSLQVGQTIIIPDAELSGESTAPTNTTVNTVAKCGSRDARIEPLLDGGKKLPAYPGYYIRPIAIGYRSQCLHGHNAIDLAAPVNTSIVASAAGTVIIAKSNGAWNGGYGNYVVISHNNGTQTLYAHMSRPTVSIGDVVSQGEQIGHIGMTGWTYGPHVHFEIRGAQNPF
jgi:murein DD-endopeptidase MepM/ murein hydrolase activator NlpD